MKLSEAPSPYLELLFNPNTPLNEEAKRGCEAYLSACDLTQVSMSEALLILVMRSRLGQSLNYQAIPVLEPFKPYLASSLSFSENFLPYQFSELRQLFILAERYQHSQAFFEKHGFALPVLHSIPGQNTLKEHIFQLEDVQRHYENIESLSPKFAKLGLAEDQARLKVLFSGICVSGVDLRSELETLYRRADALLQHYVRARSFIGVRKQYNGKETQQILAAANGYLPDLFSGNKEVNVEDVRLRIEAMPNSPAFLEAVTAFRNSTITEEDQEAFARLQEAKNGFDPHKFTLSPA